MDDSKDFLSSSTLICLVDFETNAEAILCTVLTSDDFLEIALFNNPIKPSANNKLEFSLTFTKWCATTISNISRA
ncbi:hypothetical protein WICPIJ_001391 [Wickerhamomyces pijperi]|uniref:Uncharacterized protein n=1 Tax=Wickerhamomyces pijperi TaxID=599730 RepID=A0A9P8QDY1_WICPI|nr:hypothetical protein WICPIJ_001391 [Wickerhamomyces pijperi]